MNKILSTAFLFFTLLALPYHAQSKAILLNDIKIEANHHTENSKLDELTFTGDVHLTFKNVTITGNKIILTMKNDEPTKVFGEGKILFQQHTKNLKEIAFVTCESIKLFPILGKITFISVKRMNIKGLKFIGSIINYDLQKEEITSIIR